MLKFFYFYLLIFFVFMTKILYATDQKKIEYKTGIKTYYSSGIADKNIYYQAFFESIIPIKKVELNPKISGTTHYQISDGDGNYKEISFLQTGMLLSVNLVKQLKISSEYLYSYGESKYTSHEIYAEIFFENNIFSLDTSYTKNYIEYDFDSLKIENEKGLFFIQFSYFLNNSLDLELSYEHKTTYYNNLDYTYIENIIRGGISLSVFTRAVILGGFSYGEDNDDYSIYGIDTGFLLKLENNLSLSFLYSSNYYKSSDNTTSNGQAGNGGKGQNPMLSDSAASEDSFYNHNLTFKLTYSF